MASPAVFEILHSHTGHVTICYPLAPWNQASLSNGFQMWHNGWLDLNDV